jgi:hypothetical protein
MELLLLAPLFIFAFFIASPRLRRKVRQARRAIWRAQVSRERRKAYPVRMDLRPRKGGW